MRVEKNISNNNNSVRVINCRVCAACLTRDVFLVFLFVGLSLHCFHNLSGAARCQKTHALIINITKNANIYFSGEILRACLFIRLTLAIRFGLQDVKHDDENNGDGHDENGRHGDNESCCQVTLSVGIWKMEAMM